jgi:hypothetical protein
MNMTGIAINSLHTSVVFMQATRLSSVAAKPGIAKPCIPLYYFHSKTKLYNDIFFHFWDYVMGPAFAIVCPWFTVDSQESLDRLFELEFEM